MSGIYVQELITIWILIILGHNNNKKKKKKKNLWVLQVLLYYCTISALNIFATIIPCYQPFQKLPWKFIYKLSTAVSLHKSLTAQLNEAFEHWQAKIPQQLKLRLFKEKTRKLPADSWDSCLKKPLIYNICLANMFRDSLNGKINLVYHHDLSPTPAFLSDQF